MPQMFEMMKESSPIEENLSRIRYKIAVMSGKGGAGKTTVSVNLSALLAKKGFRVGLLDADIDCPNVGKILGINENFKVEDGRLVPVEKYGMKISSMAFTNSSDSATIWRGPLIHGAILQLVEKTDFGGLDFLIIDMPPGTSDAVLTVFQSLNVDAVVIVSTPQAMSVLDAKKSAFVAEKFGKPFGFVENMSGDVFGRDKVRELAESMDAFFLGSLDLSKDISEENPTPISLRDEKYAGIFGGIVEKMKKMVDR